MKRLAFLAIGFLLLSAVMAASCSEGGTTPNPGEEVASSCIACHTDKELLKEVATPEEAEVSEVTTGEG